MPAALTPAPKMHADEIDTSVALVQRLLAAQFPAWAGLPVERVVSDGTDNALYRLGNDKVVRLPRVLWSAPSLEREFACLTRLARGLPLAIPVPLALGRPGEGFPFSWAVFRWIEGASAVLERMRDRHEVARDLAAFILALRRADVAGAPASGRAESLAAREVRVLDAIGKLRAEIDVGAVMAVWRAALQAPAWAGAPVWIHADLHVGNLLARDGRLAAVIDFGCVGLGDPACDVMAAWLYFSADERRTFRAALEVDDATWARARGWALSVGLMALPYYAQTNPALAALGRRAIQETTAG